MRNLRRFALLVGIIVALAVPVGAHASHTGYWFFQGNLPRPDGTRAVLHGNQSWPVYIRISWSPCDHRMVWVQVATGGSWDTGSFYPPSCDQWLQVQYPDLHNNYGCENPPGFASVWANCHVGSGV
jgi:hypothetical protein